MRYLKYLSFAIRPLFLLLVGLTVGYFVGFRDALRDSETIGSRVAIALGQATPDQLRAEREARAAAIRDTLKAKAGVIDPE